jgi:hypothetical protein
MSLYSYDRTGSLYQPDFGAKPVPVASHPIPGCTVIGSKVALMGVASGRKSEMKAIEGIELNEGLPHPMVAGKWCKNIPEITQKTRLWTGHTEKNLDNCLQLAKKLHAPILSRFHGITGNWGHFDVDPRWYSGDEAVRKASEKALSMGIYMGMYTMTVFIAPLYLSEPYLAPVPDSRLKKYIPESLLLNNISAADKEI